MSTSSSDSSSKMASVIDLPRQGERLAGRSQSLLASLGIRLQKTLVVEEILELFLSDLATIVPYDVYVYECEQLHIESGTRPRARHELDYNLNLSGQKLGRLRLRRRKRFGSEEIEAIEQLLTALVFPLRNALLYREAQLAALTDALTGASNRRAFEYQIQRELTRARRYEQSLAILAFDVDHFKLINDTYGHAAGDRVLKSLVATVSGSCRAADTIFRMGGEEFVMILAPTSSQDCMDIAERIRLAVAGHPIRYNGEDIRITISVGCALWHEKDCENVLLERADKALYSAKEGGRNRSVVADMNSQFVPAREA